MQKKIIFELIMSTQDVLTYSSLKTIFSSLKSIILIKWIFFLCKFNHLRTMLYIISIWSRFLPITETCFWNLSVSFDFRIFYISSEREESHKKKVIFRGSCNNFYSHTKIYYHYLIYHQDFSIRYIFQLRSSPFYFLIP